MGLQVPKSNFPHSYSLLFQIEAKSELAKNISLEPLHLDIIFTSSSLIWKPTQSVKDAFLILMLC